MRRQLPPLCRSACCHAVPRCYQLTEACLHPVPPALCHHRSRGASSAAASGPSPVPPSDSESPSAPGATLTVMQQLAELATADVIESQGLIGGINSQIAPLWRPISLSAALPSPSGPPPVTTWRSTEPSPKLRLAPSWLWRATALQRLSALGR
jgi:hypothetical protein